MSITTAQIRGARGILNWSQSDLSERTGISSTSIGSIESGNSKPRENTLQNIKASLESAGIDFLPNDGLRKKNVLIDVLTGVDGVHKLSYDVYKTTKTDKREILQAYVDDRKYAELLEGEASPHVDRMESIEGLSFKILQKEGDTYFPAENYAEYRWIPSDQFSPVPFMVYGNKLAIMLFENEPSIIVINYPMVAEAYRLQFFTMWDAGIVPDLGKVGA